MTDAQPFPVEEALAFVEEQREFIRGRATMIALDERYARLAATLRQLSAPRPVPPEIGSLIDALLEADRKAEIAKRSATAPLSKREKAKTTAAAARAALEAAIMEPSEQLEAEVRKLVIRHFGSLDSWVPLGDVVRLIRAQVNQDQCVPRKRA